VDALLQPSIALAVVLVVVVVTNRWRVLGWGRCVPFQHHDMVRWGNVLMVLLAFMDNGSAMAAPAILGSKNPSHEGPCMMCTSQEHTPFATEWTGWHRVEHHGSSGSKDPSHDAHLTGACAIASGRHGPEERSKKSNMASVRHGFVNPRGYPGMGKAGTGTGDLVVTCRKPTPVARVWRVF